MILDALHISICGGAALVAGAINAIAGGGSLITFPTMVALGVPPIVANVTNTVSQCPGYLGATYAQRRDLEGQGKRAALLLPLSAIAGLFGGWLLLHTGQGAFDRVVPFLILLAAVMVGVQDPVRRWILARTKTTNAEVLAAIPVTAAGVYGGYFGAGLGVMVLAALGVVHSDSIQRLTAMKQIVSLSVNLSAALLFLFTAPIDWPLALVMAIGALVGGIGGGVLATRIPARILRIGIVVLGVTVAAVYFVKTW